MTKSMIVNLLLTIMLVSFFACNKDDINPKNTDFDPYTMGDYYVSPKGDDNNPGTYDKPFATWQKGFETAEPGDTVYFRGGVWYPQTCYKYTSSVVYINPYDVPNVGNDATAANPICMFAFPGETPILDCINVSIPNKFLGGIGMDRANYWHIRGLTIRNVLESKLATVHGFITGGCSNLTVENLTVTNIGGKGIVNYNTFQNAIYPEQASIPYDTTRYINCDASYCMDSLGRSGAATDFGNYADGFWVQASNPVSYVIFEGCRSWMNSDDGYDLPTVGVIFMHNCWAFNNGHLIAGGGSGIRNDPASNDLDKPWIIKNSIAASNKGSNYTVGYNHGIERPLEFYNNLSYDGEYGIVFYRQDTTTYGRVDRDFRNNVSFNNGTFDLLCHLIPLIYTNNYWGTKRELLGQSMSIPDHSPAVTATTSDFQSLDISQLSAPRKADGSLPDITFGRLATGSDLIGAGTDVGMSSTPDIGIDWAYLDSKVIIYP